MPVLGRRHAAATVALAGPGCATFPGPASKPRAAGLVGRRAERRHAVGPECRENRPAGSLHAELCPHFVILVRGRRAVAQDLEVGGDRARARVVQVDPRRHERRGETARRGGVDLPRLRRRARRVVDARVCLALPQRGIAPDQPVRVAGRAVKHIQRGPGAVGDGLRGQRCKRRRQFAASQLHVQLVDRDIADQSRGCGRARQVHTFDVDPCPGHVVARVTLEYGCDRAPVRRYGPANYVNSPCKLEILPSPAETERAIAQLGVCLRIIGPGADTRYRGDAVP